jgi:acyl-CoA synthetase (AMP-forming)/AMP-acid ligase II
VPACSLNYASVVPTQIHAILDADAARGHASALESLSVLVSNAAPLPQATKHRLIERLPHASLFDSYGATELGMVAHLRPEEMLQREHCVGLAAPGVELRIVDERGRDSPRGDVGRIVVRSPWLFTGYFGDEDATAHAWIGDWCGVGDLGRQDADGYLYLVDRLHNVINSGGQNIYASEVEQALYSHPAVAEAAVVGVPHTYWGEAVYAVVRLRSGTSLSAEQLVEHCAGQLARYKLPKRVEFWDELPQSAAGKVLHREIRERLRREAQAVPVAP